MSSDEEKNMGSVVGHHHESQVSPAPPPPGIVVGHHHESLPSPDHLPLNPPSAIQYGTFQGVPSFPPPRPRPAIGFPQPATPPGAAYPSGYPPRHGQYYPHGYQSVPGYAVAEGRPVHDRRLPFCGIGFGWFLFVAGFFLCGVPWYAGVILLICSRDLDYREKPGYIMCAIAAAIETVAILLGVTHTADDW